MHLVRPEWNVAAVLAVVLTTSMTRTVVQPPVEPSAAATTNSCAAPEYRSFDFWVGDWDAFDVDNPSKKVAHNRVDRILDGCALLEDYQSVEGEHGQSFTIYDASRKVWHQTWVTNRGQLLIIEGTFEADEMVLTGVDPAAAEPTLVRGTWKPVSGGVREIGVTSTDDGKTWKPWFDLVFRPHKQ